MQLHKYIAKSLVFDSFLQDRSKRARENNEGDVWQRKRNRGNIERLRTVLISLKYDLSILALPKCQHNLANEFNARHDHLNISILSRYRPLPSLSASPDRPDSHPQAECSRILDMHWQAEARVRVRYSVGQSRLRPPTATNTSLLPVTQALPAATPRAGDTTPSVFSNPTSDDPQENSHMLCPYLPWFSYYCG